ncbi:MAG: hypothetical protein HY720_02395 [Planctomycetes bacterium]|nr:hypothetical protein [Planctomycetota bacterium]
MLRIEKRDDGRYRLTDGTEEVVFAKEKFEDLYYAVPTHATQFYRLLVEEVAAIPEERALMNRMIGGAGSREKVLNEIQEAIRGMPRP